MDIEVRWDGDAARGRKFLIPPLPYPRSARVRIYFDDVDEEREFVASGGVDRAALEHFLLEALESPPLPGSDAHYFKLRESIRKSQLAVVPVYAARTSVSGHENVRVFLERLDREEL